jgi:hypothetical protein
MILVRRPNTLGRLVALRRSQFDPLRSFAFPASGHCAFSEGWRVQWETAPVPVYLRESFCPLGRIRR